MDTGGGTKRTLETNGTVVCYDEELNLRPEDWTLLLSLKIRGEIIQTPVRWHGPSLAQLVLDLYHHAVSK